MPATSLRSVIERSASRDQNAHDLGVAEMRGRDQSGADIRAGDCLGIATPGQCDFQHRHIVVHRRDRDDVVLLRVERVRVGAAREKLLTAVVGGIWAGDPEKLGAESAFPKMVALEQAHGSLLRALRNGSGPPSRGALVSFPGGLQVLGEALAATARTVHHGHTFEYAFPSDTEASGRWAMEDIIDHPVRGLLRGHGHYHERYRRDAGRWRFAAVHLTRLRLDLAPAVGAPPN